MATPPAFHPDELAPTDLKLVREIELCALRAWPALEEVRYSDWLLRFSKGYTKRANSVNAAEIGAGWDGVVSAAETLYAQRGLPTIFRITPLAAPDVDAALKAAGWAKHDPSWVYTLQLESAAPCKLPSALRLATLATQPWLEGYASTSALSAQHQGTHMEMLQKIRQPCAFATWRPGPTAAPVAWALAVRDGRHVGIFDVVVSPQHRRQGHGRALMLALLRWAQGDGAASAYLQVTASNTAARALYASLGFEPAYPYHYRVPTPGKPG